jgi:hypothetical protein
LRRNPYFSKSTYNKWSEKNIPIFLAEKNKDKDSVDSDDKYWSTVIVSITSNVANILNQGIIDKQLVQCPLLKENRLDHLTIWDEIKED